MTEVQRATIPHSLVGRDVLGAAKTGSGKTIAFLIPILEKLFRLSWSKGDGLGALILSPTRELAMQTFNVLRKIGAPHTFTAGLLIGGTDWKAEQHRIAGMNILVATPGRLLQHMDETPTFRTDNLQILVLDEADQILNSGFQKEVNAIIQNLPTDRQTLLFSATQTSSVADLARLSLSHPEYLSVHAEADNATPDKLVQNYIYVNIGDKLNYLWSFIKAHLRKKILVFFHSQRQVRFVFEIFRHMRPGLPVMHLHGKMGQTTRREVFDKFQKSKFAVMLATDLAARGLDFTGIHWVIQADCPESVEQYIHRVGRTARFHSSGKSTLFLLPSESEFKTKLLEAKIPISKTNINPSKIMEIDIAIQALLVQKPELKLYAQKAIKSYLKGTYLMSDKTVFDVTKLDMGALALSYGLLQVPRIRFMDVKKIDKNAEIMKAKIRAMESKFEKFKEEHADLDDDTLLELFQKEKASRQKVGKSRLDRILTKKNADVFSEQYQQYRPASGNAVFDTADDEDEGELLVKKSRLSIDLDSLPDISAVPKKTKDRQKIFLYKDSDQLTTFKYSEDEGSEDDSEEDSSIPYAQRVARMIQEVDTADRKTQAERQREKRQKRKAKEKEAKRLEATRKYGDLAATIGTPIEGSENEEEADETEKNARKHDEYRDHSDNESIDTFEEDFGASSSSSESASEDVIPPSKKRKRQTINYQADGDDNDPPARKRHKK